jgi:hypothetical protein
MNSCTYPSERGQSLVIVALLLIVLIGMLALTLDGGYAYLQRRASQTAADAGALAGAHELCETGDANLAVNRALEYDIDHNGAHEAIATVEEGVVTVEAYITFSTFFGRIFSRPEITTAAIAAAKCVPAGEAVNILPIGWNCPADDWVEDGTIHYCDWNYGNEEQLETWYIILNSDKLGDDDQYCITDGGTVDCDMDGDGDDELLIGGNRGWLDLNGSASDDGNGSAELVEWILNGYPNPVRAHTFFAGQAGVSTNVFVSVKERLGATLLLPVYNHISYGIPELPYDTLDPNDDPQDQVIISNGASTTYYHVITFSCFVPMCVKAQGNDRCDLWQMGREKGSIKPQDKTIEGYFTKCSEDIISPGDHYAGAYIVSLVR